MKTPLIILFFILLFSFTSFSQNKLSNSTIEKKTIKYYLVKETVNMGFGGTTTTYTVSDIRLINNIKLGPNNTRTITPIYKTENKIKKNDIPIEIKPIETQAVQSTTLIEELSKSDTETLQKALEFLYKTDSIQNTTDLQIFENNGIKYIDMINIYEKVAERGYKSILVFFKIGDAFYFGKEMEKAVKWYTELFAMTTNLDPVYLFRYADSLNKTGNTEKGKLYMNQYSKLTNVEIN